MSKNSKKYGNHKWILIGVILLIVLLPIILLAFIDRGLTTYEKINVSRLEKMIKNKDDFILYINSRQCVHCQAFKPKLNSVIQEYGVKVYGIDIYGMKTSDLNRLKNIVQYQGTPTIVFFEGGVEISESGYNRIEGNLSKDEIISKFKYNGYIKE